MSAPRHDVATHAVSLPALSAVAYRSTEQTAALLDRLLGLKEHLNNVRLRMRERLITIFSAARLGSSVRLVGIPLSLDYLETSDRFQTGEVSASITQDVLLLAGSEDHYVPLDQWHAQIKMLKNAHSITARLFTNSEHAGNHCHVGNYGLALRTIVSWLDERVVEDNRAAPYVAARRTMP